MEVFPSRQVHLDFHTSEFMQNVGEKFEKKLFQEALKLGHVNSVTIFGKCHHGYSYYPTKIGTSHPGMKKGRDLAGEMMEACHEIGVHAPLYLTLGWSALDAKEHPEWIVRKRDGSYSGVNYDFQASGTEKKPEVSWINLCSAGGYRKHLYQITEEVCQRYKQLDGLFFDIVFVYDSCYCDHCVQGMKKLELNPESEADAQKYCEMQKKITVDGLCSILKKYHPKASIFFNSGGAEIHKPQWHYASTHFELEDLPTTGGGYDKMPMRARYFSGLGKPYLGMTGKFHRSWGEFGGYKTPEALTYECAAMAAHGARVSIGDQLHPSGKIDMATYENIGKAYSYLEKIEKYCFEVEETSNLGVLVSTDAKKNEAMAKLLLDCHLDFDVIHKEGDLKRFDTVIIPDQYRLQESMGEAFEQYLSNGGKVVILGGGGLKENADEFAFSVPFTYLGKSEYDMDYLECTDSSGEIPNAPILCYESAHKVFGNGEISAFVREPYFSRTYEKYCSHYNTPYQEEQAKYPAAVKNGNILYIAHEISKMYEQYGVVYHRRYFQHMLKLLYDNPVIYAEMPSQGRIHLVRRKGKDQYVLHLMYAPAIQRGEVSVLEDFPKLENISVRLHVPEKIKKVRLLPQNQDIAFERGIKEWKMTIPNVQGYQMVVIDYEIL